MFRNEAEFTAWVESVETWIKSHIDRHHNSSESAEDRLLERPVTAPDVHEEVEPVEPAATEPSEPSEPVTEPQA